MRSDSCAQIICNNLSSMCKHVWKGVYNRFNITRIFTLTSNKFCIFTPILELETTILGLAIIVWMRMFPTQSNNHYMYIYIYIWNQKCHNKFAYKLGGVTTLAQTFPSHVNLSTHRAKYGMKFFIVKCVVILLRQFSFENGVKDLDLDSIGRTKTKLKSIRVRRDQVLMMSYSCTMDNFAQQQAKPMTLYLVSRLAHVGGRNHCP